MRDSFINELVNLNRSGSRVYLLVGDLGYSVVEPFADEFPEFFINVGVAEQNMAGIAAGIASEGHQVFCYSIGNFNTFRCAEQLRNDVDYHKFPVCTVSVGGGVAYGAMGYSHHAVQDYALMRSMPNTLVCSPVDPSQTRLCLSLIILAQCPSYLRLHKSKERIIDLSYTDIIPGMPRYIAGNKNASTALLTTGYAGQKAFNIVQDDSDYVLYTMPAWGFRYRSHIAKFAEKYEKIITIEDHLLDGGFGSWILESLIQTEHIKKIKINSLSLATIETAGSEDFLHNISRLFTL